MQSSVEGILRGGKFKQIMENRLTDMKDRTGLKRVDIEVIYFLYRAKEHNTMTDICQHLQMNKGHISSVMNSLCEKGYVVQNQDPNDRRYIRYTLTELADSVAEQMDASWEKISRKMLEGISRDDLAVFSRVAEQIERNIENMLVQ